MKPLEEPELSWNRICSWQRGECAGWKRQLPNGDRRKSIGTRPRLLSAAGRIGPHRHAHRDSDHVDLKKAASDAHNDSVPRA
jgi:hypothetical protein